MNEIDYTPLQDIPSVFKELTEGKRATTIYDKMNKFRQLDSRVRQLETLFYPEIVNQPREKILNLMIVGTTGVGKSFLINKIAGKAQCKVGDGAVSTTKRCTSQKTDTSQSPQILKKFSEINISDTIGFLDADQHKQMKDIKDQPDYLLMQLATINVKAKAKVILVIRGQVVDRDAQELIYKTARSFFPVKDFTSEQIEDAPFYILYNKIQTLEETQQQFNATIKKIRPTVIETIEDSIKELLDRDDIKDGNLPFPKSNIVFSRDELFERLVNSGKSFALTQYNTVYPAFNEERLSKEEERSFAKTLKYINSFRIKYEQQVNLTKAFDYEPPQPQNELYQDLKKNRSQLVEFHQNVLPVLKELKYFIQQLKDNEYPKLVYNRLPREDLQVIMAPNNSHLKQVMIQVSNEYNRMLEEVAAQYAEYFDNTCGLRLELNQYNHRRAFFDSYTQYSRYADIFTMIGLYDPLQPHQDSNDNVNFIYKAYIVMIFLHPVISMFTSMIYVLMKRVKSSELISEDEDQKDGRMYDIPKSNSVESGVNQSIDSNIRNTNFLPNEEYKATQPTQINLANVTSTFLELWYPTTTNKQYLNEDESSKDDIYQYALELIFKTLPQIILIFISGFQLRKKKDIPFFVTKGVVLFYCTFIKAFLLAKQRVLQMKKIDNENIKRDNDVNKRQSTLSSHQNSIGRSSSYQ